MNAAVALGAVYLAQLWVKSALALVRRAREKVPAAAALERVTLIQPVTSGDEKLGSVLQENLEELSGAAIIWIVDSTDRVAFDLCEALKAAHPARKITLVVSEEPPAGINPKLWKQEAALRWVQSELVAVIDDDTIVPRPSLDLLISYVDAGATIATGLPCYVPARGPWSQMVAEFVNSAAILTYLPATLFAEPLSINGMCYVLKTDFVRATKLFTISSRSVTDDLAIAKVIRQRGGRIVQTARCHFISTTVTSLAHYRRLMHRWFVCTRLLVQNEPIRVQVALSVAYGLHPVLLTSLVIWSAAGDPFAAWTLLAVLGFRAMTLGLLNRIITGTWRHAFLSSVFTEVFQPGFLVSAFFYPVIWWRKRKIRVRKFDEFDYLIS